MRYGSPSGVTKIYRIILYYESDQGPLPLDKVIPKMVDSNGREDVWNVEAEQQVQAENGAFVNAGSETYDICDDNPAKPISLRTNNHSREVTTLPQPKWKDKEDGYRNTCSSNCVNSSKQTSLSDFGLLI